AEQASAGEGRLVLVGGEAGVGKSTLVEAFAERQGGARWAWGMCDGLFTPRPLGPLFDIADVLGGELLELSRARAPRDQLFGALRRALAAVDVVVMGALRWAGGATTALGRSRARRLRTGRARLGAPPRAAGLAPGAPLGVALGETGPQRPPRRIGL